MKRSTLVICAVMFALVTWGTLAYADAITANVQFPFKAAGQEFAAGKYRIEVDLQSEQIKLQNEATGKGALMTYRALISGRGDEALVVFDKQGDQYYLSEIYVPGTDGFELKGATGKHTHVKVKAGK